MTEEIDATTSSPASDVDLTSADIPQPMTRQRIQWPGGPSIKQSFSLPESIIYYIAKNPFSAEGYMKLIQSCKYFFEKNAILVAAQIHGNTKICSSKTCKRNNEKCCLDFDIKKCLSKIWLTKKLLLVLNRNPMYNSLLCPKLYRSETECLELMDQTVLLDHFKFLTTSLTHLVVGNVKFINNDGNIVSIDEVLEFVPKLKKFGFDLSNDQSTSTIKSISKLNNLGHLKFLGLLKLPEIYSVEFFSNFIKAHKDMIIWIDFIGTISEDYKNQLDALIDYIIESELPNQIIEYDGQDVEKYRIMDSRWDYD